MISDWRGDRLIGPPSFWDGVGDPLRFAAIAIAVLALESALVVVVKTWGDAVSPTGYVRMASIIFGVQVALISIGGLFGPNKGRSIALGLLGGGLTLVVWFWSLPVLVALGVLELLPIVRLTP